MAAKKYRRPSDLTKKELADFVTDVFHVLWPPGPEIEWNADTTMELASLFERARVKVPSTQSKKST